MSTKAWNEVAATMAKRVGGGNFKDGEKLDIFMKLNSKHHIRLVGDPIAVNIGWYNKGKYIIPDDVNYIQKAEEILGIKVRRNLVVNVIDRDDQKKRLAEGKTTRFKILEKGTAVFENIITHFKEVMKGSDSPGDNNGVDWIVIASIPASDPRQTKYNVIPSSPTPFTQEEMSVIARADKDGKNPKDEFKDLPIGERGVIDFDLFYNQEKAKKKLDALFEEVEKNGGPVPSEDEPVRTPANVAAPAATPAPVAKPKDLDSIF